jgi:hypothetical protein
MLPTLGKAKAKGQAIACASNLRQLELALELYTPKLNTGILQCANAVNDQDRNDHRWLLERTPYWDWPLRSPQGPTLP